MRDFNKNFVELSLMNSKRFFVWNFVREIVHLNWYNLALWNLKEFILWRFFFSRGPLRFWVRRFYFAFENLHFGFWWCRIFLIGVGGFGYLLLFMSRMVRFFGWWGVVSCVEIGHFMIWKIDFFLRKKTISINNTLLLNFIN